MSSEKGTTHDWELFPEKYATDASGNFLLKKDGTPRKKSGRAKGSKSRGYNYSSKTKARMSAERSVRDKRRRVETVEAKLRQQKTSLNNSKEILKKLDNKSNNKIHEYIGAKIELFKPMKINNKLVKYRNLVLPKPKFVNFNVLK